MPRDVFELLDRHIPLTEEQFHRLNLYHELLVKWQSKINLVSPETLSDAWARHFLDSLQLSLHIKEDGGNILDFGTGAGFPGMALAVYGIPHIHLVESDTKKIAFLKEVSRVTKSPAEIHHTRVENFPSKKFGVIMSRAVASLDQLLSYASPFVSHETFCLFPKGKNYDTELEDAKKNWNFRFNLIPSVTDDQGVIIKLFDLEKRHHEHLIRT